MKRLIRRSFESIILYHGTSLEYLKHILENGWIEPSGYTGNTSGGRSRKLIDLDDVESPESYLSLSELRRYNQGEITEKLKNYLMSLENPNADTKIPIKTLDDSENANGVYLTNSIMNANYYANKSSTSTNSHRVVLTINVQTDALGPDYDDLSGELESNETPKYLQSLEKTQQCVHYGPISIDDIQSVKILPSENPSNISQYCNKDLSIYEVQQVVEEYYNNL